jgi:hypothetical protein
MAFSLSDAIFNEKYLFKLSKPLAAATDTYCFLACVNITLKNVSKAALGDFRVHIVLANANTEKIAFLY